MATTVDRLDQFFAQYKHLKFKKGEIFLRPNDTPKGVCFLKKGYVRQYSISPEGEELTLIIFRPGDFFPIIWAFNNSPYSYYLETITAVELHCTPREEFLKFIKENPQVFAEIASKVLIRMGALMTRMEYLVFGNAYNKVASIIALCAERFADKGAKGFTFPFPLTHKQIANLIGLSRETASIEIKNLELEKYVKYEGRSLIVTNLKGLQELSLLHENF